MLALDRGARADCILPYWGVQRAKSDPHFDADLPIPAALIQLCCCWLIAMLALTHAYRNFRFFGAERLCQNSHSTKPLIYQA